MERRYTKKEIVKILINQDLDIENEEQLIDILINQPVSIDVDKELDSNITFGEKMADKLTAAAGSWTFIICFISLLLLWIILNVFFISKDPYPFILLNLMLSCIAAIQAPIIMMSQNREATRERKRNQNDYKTDLKSALILEELHKQLNELIRNQRKIIRYLDSENDDLDKLSDKI